MIRPLFAALVLAFVPQDRPGEVDGAKAAQALLDRVEAKVKSAKSIRFTVRVTMQGAMFEAAKEQEPLAGEILLRGAGEARLQVTVEKAPILIRSDGKIVAVEGDMRPTMNLPREPKALVDMLRKVAVLGFIALQPDEGEAKIDMTPVNFMIGGREKVEGVDTQVLSYDFKSSQPMLDRLTVRVWIDPARLAVVKREYDIRAFARLTEVLSKIAYDEDLPADEFALQSARSVRVAVEAQVARSVELYARYMGRLPERLEDLDAPPKDAAFWPEGGFWIGGKRPADLKYSVANGVATLGPHTIPAPTGGRIAPTSERLKRHYSSRVRLHLVRAAVEAWHKAYSRLPEKIEHLGAKPGEIEFFPDGGYVSTPMLKDPGGEALILSMENDTAVLAVAKASERAIKPKQLTADESAAMMTGAFPAATPESKKALAAAIDRLSADDLPTREQAVKDLIAMGPSAAVVVEQRLQAATGEIAARLKTVRAALNALPQSWRSELRLLTASFRPGKADEGSPDSNERSAATLLKVITTAQADFRSNDRDGNRTSDFWVQDVAGLYGIVGATGDSTECHAGKAGETNAIRLIEPGVAAADTTEGRWEYGVLGVKEPEAWNGYFVAALKNCQMGGETGPYHKGGGRNEDMFGFVAYPEDYGVTGRKTYIVNEDNTVWWKDLGPGGTIDTFPGSPPAEGWSKVD